MIRVSVTEPRSRSQLRIAPIFRFVALLAALAVGTACPAGHAVHLAVVPTSDPHGDTAGDSGLALVARIAARHGLQPTAPQENDLYRWTQCFHNRGISLCAKAARGNTEILLGQYGGSRKFAPPADRLRLELEDSLAARFGRSSVHECDVKYEPDPDAPWWIRTNRAICVPQPRADSILKHSAKHRSVSVTLAA